MSFACRIANRTAGVLARALSSMKSWIVQVVGERCDADPGLRELARIPPRPHRATRRSRRPSQAPPATRAIAPRSRGAGTQLLRRACQHPADRHHRTTASRAWPATVRRKTRCTTRYPLANAACIRGRVGTSSGTGHLRTAREFGRDNLSWLIRDSHLGARQPTSGGPVVSAATTDRPTANVAIINDIYAAFGRDDVPTILDKIAPN
jgi:hypothetical protein